MFMYIIFHSLPLASIFYHYETYKIKLNIKIHQIVINKSLSTVIEPVSQVDKKNFGTSILQIRKLLAFNRPFTLHHMRVPLFLPLSTTFRS
jgi:hypothetical protein